MASKLAAKTRSFPALPSMIGPLHWREHTMSEIKDSVTIIGRSDKTIELGRKVDPLPHFRSALCDLSNDEAMLYARQVRLVVHRLRENVVDTIDEIKSLQRVREALERLHEHIRKDLKTNCRCKQTRLTRPVREKCMDGADCLLSAEETHLDNLKKMLEAHLKLVKIQLQTLDAAVRRLTAVEKERSRVIDLIGYAVPSIGGQKLFTRTYNFAVKCKPSTEIYVQPCSTSKLFPVEPLGAFTNECDDAIEDGRIAREHSVTLRQEAHELMKRVEDIQKTVHETVNRAVTQKMTETENLKIHLELAIAQNRLAANRAHRHYDKTENSFFHFQGPESSHDLNTHEKPNRPIISHFQRHPGTNVPETQEIMRVADGPRYGVMQTGRNRGLLKLAERGLLDDRHDKLTAMNIENSVLKLRRRRADHRWNTGGVVEHSLY